ncbi:MAG: YjbQ family protein [Deltaproteobacteria bacterium]|nr:YjbQ family protein [Deltaproteobacteria bacterium]
MQTGTVTVTTANYMELVDITSSIEKELAKSKIDDGVCYLYNPHTTAGLTINEGADPAVRTDIVKALKKIIPFDLAYQHQEGNSPSHVLASLFGSSLTVFVENGRLKLGAWQKIFFCEFDGPRTRKVHWRIV